MAGRQKNALLRALFDASRRDARKVTLAPVAFITAAPEEAARKHRRVLVGEERRQVVESVTAILGDWRLSPWEHEGPARHVLRSDLCLRGARWVRADADAERIVAEGLRAIGAPSVRPTWDEGQRYAAGAKEQCRYCAGPIPQRLFGGNAKPLFCSDGCARRAHDLWEFEVGRFEGSSALAAYRGVLRSRHQPRTCQNCGTAFRPVRDADAKNRFCSPECAATGSRTIPERECAQCGALFRPRSNQDAGIFCSVTCKHDSFAARKIVRTCVYCGDEFQAKTEKAQYCGDRHMFQAMQVAKRIAKMEATGKPYSPRGPERHHAERMIAEHFAAKNAAPAPCLTAEALDNILILADYRRAKSDPAAEAVARLFDGAA